MRSLRSERVGTPCARSTRPVFLIVTALVIAVAPTLAACGTSGRELRAPEPGAIAPPRSSLPGASTTGAVIESAGMRLRSSAWSDGGAMPAAYTCDGIDTSPPLLISGVPEEVSELVLVVTDRDRPEATKWVLAGIGSAVTNIPQGSVPSGVVQIVNSSGTALWSGPCPAEGRVEYQFTLYGLTAPSRLGASAGADEVERVISAAEVSASMFGSFTRR